ncbi:diguanylate cyclase (GGDEF) domain-containing protein [Nitrosospira sp. Nsp11]|uniref:EAL domain-containing protein n=1 Tax=Nitrosospira sp. Nsp11 TaxID=1855338 RepID=UPI00091FA454|nr:EAL domain-containing protein [Nitrosospira sp. Nsp11]SHM28037.1 diguanylate cyclase (GGDEF) domain-containing protein [Nitrosospira sp. Nsp11]
MAHDVSTHDVRKAKILIAEDSPTQAEKLRYLLEENNFKVTTAGNGKQALAAARQCKPALIVSDVMMPEMDGFALCAEIKRDAQLKDIPMIMLTSLSDIRDIMKGLESGADNFIRKPYDDQYLLDRIDYLLMSHELRKSQKMQMGMEIYLGGQKHFITTERQQIVDLLISVYEDAVHLNYELNARQLELTHSNRLLNGLYQIAEGLNQAVTEREVCEKALEYVVELPGVQAGWLYLWDGSGVRLAGARNVPVSLAAESIEALCECRRLLLSGEFSHAPKILQCEHLIQHGDHASLPCYHASIPLWSGNQSQGVMNLLGLEQAQFKDNELDTFYGVGYQVSVALERARLHEHMEKLVEERTAALTAEISRRKEYEARVVRLNRIYSVLSGINTTIVRVREIQELFDEACRIATTHGEFVFTWIGMFEANTGQITPMAKAGRGDGYLSRLDLAAVVDAPGGSCLIGDVITHLKPAICNDLNAYRRTQSSLVQPPDDDYLSMAVLPLTLDGQLAGILALYARETGFFDDEEMTLLIEMAGDISFAMDHLKKEERINYLAFFDAVTDLPNRALFLDRVDQRIQTVSSDHKMLSVIVLDIERFSSINESLGHGAGDSLLRQLAKRLKQLLSETDILAHLSADYFAIARTHEEESTDIAHILEKLLFEVQNQPFLTAGQELRVSVRAGTSSYPADGRDTDTLLRNAETALKKAKLSSDKHLFYAPEFHARVKEKLKLETRLRQALEQEQLVLHYQPKIDLENGKISGLEALMRWEDPENGLIPPLNFIPLLEETRMILEAGRWALGKAISDAQKWKSLGLNPPVIAVNVSAIQLQQKDFVSMVADVLRNAGEVSVGLQLEITESVIMNDIEANIEKLSLIRDMNIQIAIDDFGTGYSSLSYIAKLPVNVLKIDRAFIINMNTNPDDLSIVSAIISLAHSLHLRVIAEGVETIKQADLLRRLKCEEMQGYLFSPGVTTDKIEEFLREKKSLPTWSTQRI